MSHPDADIERVLSVLDVGTAAARAALTIPSWDEFAEFVGTAVEGSPRAPEINRDLAHRRLEDHYGDFQMASLFRCFSSARALYPGHDFRWFAALSRGVSYHYDLPLLDQAIEDISPTLLKFSAEQLQVFDDSRFDILSRPIVWRLGKILVESKVSVPYARALPSSVLPGEAGLLFHTVEVPVEYLRDDVMDAVDFHSAPSLDSLGEAFEAVLARLGWHCAAYIYALAALAIGQVPADYIVAARRRDAAHIIRLYRAGVPEQYVHDAGPGVFSSDVIRGFQEGVPGEYLNAGFDASRNT